MSRSTTMGLSVLTAVAVAALSGCAGQAPASTGEPETAAGTVVAAPLAATATEGPEASGSGCAQEVPQPTWTPSLVTDVTVQCPGEIVESAPGVDTPEGLMQDSGTAHVATILAYSLSGEANQEVAQGAGLAAAEESSVSEYRPATSLMLYVYPDANAIDRSIGGEGILTSTVTLENGAEALVTQGDNGYGVTRVAWTDGTYSYLLLTTVMKTDDGTSGVPLEEMLTMAASVNS